MEKSELNLEYKDDGFGNSYPESVQLATTLLYQIALRNRNGEFSDIEYLMDRPCIGNNFTRLQVENMLNSIFVSQFLITDCTESPKLKYKLTTLLF